MVGLFILGTLLVMLAVSLGQFRGFNHYQLVRQRCISGAQAQLDSIAVTGLPIDEKDLDRLWPTITVSIEKSEGSGQWQGLQLVKAKAQGKSGGRTVTVALSRYVLPTEEK